MPQKTKLLSEIERRSWVWQHSLELQCLGDGGGKMGSPKPVGPHKILSQKTKRVDSKPSILGKANFTTGEKENRLDTLSRII